MRDFAANDIILLADISLYVTPKDHRGVRVLHHGDGRPIREVRWLDSGRNALRERRGGLPVFPVRSELEGIPGARANWRGGDLGYLRSKWELSVEELAALLGATPGRTLTLLASPAGTLAPEECLRLSVLLQINKALLDLLQPERTRQWLRSEATMAAFDGGSPLDQLVIWGIAAMDRMYRALSRYVGGNYSWLEADGLPRGFDWVLDLSSEEDDGSL
jgi:hypothetical protein